MYIYTRARMGVKKLRIIVDILHSGIHAIARTLAMLLLALIVGTTMVSAGNISKATPLEISEAAQQESKATQPENEAAQPESEEVSRPNAIEGIEVHFRFDQAKYDPDYMGNSQSLEKFAHFIDSIGLNNIDSVVIVSQSSPEGVYEHNIKLSRRRATTMRQLIESRHPELSDYLHVHPDGESWQQLRNYVVKDSKMKQSTIDKVLSVIDADINIGTKKWRMEQLAIYPYLRQTYYPRIRNSVFCIVYFDDALVPIVAEKPSTMETEEVIEEPVFRDDFPFHNTYTYREPMLNVHSNLLYDMGTALNVGIEYYPHNSRWTFAANYSFPWWSIEKSHLYFQVLDGELEARRYFKKPVGFESENGLSGHYLSIYGHANLYDISLNAAKHTAWQGEGWGLGLGYGYVWQPWTNKRWKLEAFVRFGYYHSLYDPYVASDPFNGKYYYDWEGKVEDFIRRNHRLRWFGPTSAGITLSYDLFMRKVKLER